LRGTSVPLFFIGGIMAKVKEEEVPAFVPVKVMDPRSGARKRVNTQEQLDLHLSHGWVIWES
jgi:hypothetical protein